MTKDEQALWAKYKKTITAQRLAQRGISDLQAQVVARNAQLLELNGDLSRVNQLMSEVAGGNTIEAAMSDMGLRKAFVDDMREELENV